MVSKNHSKEDFLSQVKFWFSDISHLIYVSMCVKDKNLKDRSFSQWNSVLKAVFMDCTFQFILCLLSIYTKSSSQTKFLISIHYLGIIFPMVLPQSLRLVHTVDISTAVMGLLISHPLWTVSCSSHHYSILLKLSIMSSLRYPVSCKVSLIETFLHQRTYFKPKIHN